MQEKAKFTGIFICRKYIEDIYFFEMNTKYISSNVLKISVISRVRSTSELSVISRVRKFKNDVKA